jgi:hypothetical protein
MKMHFDIPAVHHRESRLPRADVLRRVLQADPSPGQSVSRCGAVLEFAVETDRGDPQRTRAAGLTAL